MHSKLAALIKSEFPEACNHLCKWSFNSNPHTKQKETTLFHHKCRFLDACYAAISAQSFETEGCGQLRTFLQRASPHGVIIEHTPKKLLEPSNPVTIHHMTVTFQPYPIHNCVPLKYRNIQQILGKGPSEVIVSSLNQIADKFRCSGKGSTSNSMLDHLVLAEVTVTKWQDCSC